MSYSDHLETVEDRALIALLAGHTGSYSPTVPAIEEVKAYLKAERERRLAQQRLTHVQPLLTVEYTALNALLAGHDPTAAVRTPLPGEESMTLKEFYQNAVDTGNVRRYYHIGPNGLPLNQEDEIGGGYDPNFEETTDKK